MAETDTLLMIPMEDMNNGDRECSKDTKDGECFDGEKVANVGHDSEEDDDIKAHRMSLEDHVSIPILTDDPEMTRRNPPHQRHLSPERDDRDTLSTETDITLDTTLDTTPNAPLQSSQDTTPCNFTPAQIPPPPPDLIPNQGTPGGGTAMPALIEDSTAMSDVSDPDRTPVSVVIVRTPSRTSIATTINLDVCRICHCESEPGAPLISPCICSGSLKWVHQACLQQWIKSADTKSCELCKFDFSMTTKIKPFRKWQKLEMSTVERRKIMCSVTFHIIAITCVIWSLYVLIDKTTQEIRMNNIEWPFWTKLIVVAIGFTGGLVFMYVQCKMYVQLCRRWRAYNRVIFIQDLPDEALKTHKVNLMYTQSKLILTGNNTTTTTIQTGNNTTPTNHNTSLFGDTDLL